MHRMYRLLPLIIALVIIIQPAQIVTTKAQDNTTGVVIEGNFGGDPKNLNPLLVGDASSQRIETLLFPPLVGVDPKTANFAPSGKFPGAVAESWTISSDQLTYTFKLRKDFKWSDGQPLTAKDFQYSYDAVVSGKVDSNLTGPTQEKIVSAKALDDYTLEVTFKQASCTALADVGNIYVVPSHMFKPDFSDINDGPFDTNPSVTASVFKFKELRPSEQVTLVADPNYPDPLDGKVMPQGYIYKAVPDATVQIEQFLAGQINVVDGPIVGRRDDIKKDPSKYQAYDYPGNSWDYVGWNLADPANPKSAVDDKGNATNADQGHHQFFGDVRVRKALALAVNVDEIMKKAVFGYATRMPSGVIPASWAFDKDLKPLPYDVEAAGKLLDEAGFPKGADGLRVAKGAMYAKDGTPFKFTMYTNAGNPRRTAAGSIIQDELKQIGVSVDFQPIDFNTLIDKINAQTFDSFLLGWQNSYPDDPDLTSLFTPVGDIVGSGQNSTSYNNPEFTKLEKDGLFLPGCDQKGRADIYKKAQKILQDDQPYMFLYATNGEFAANVSVGKFNPYPSNFLWNVDQWVVKATVISK
ncbi:MAG: ABC transporter substrate-binding protein [Chloroflexota bacterium]